MVCVFKMLAHNIWWLYLMGRWNATTTRLGTALLLARFRGASWSTIPAAPVSNPSESRPVKCREIIYLLDRHDIRRHCDQPPVRLDIPKGKYV